MWKEGCVGIPKKDGSYEAFRYVVKVFDEPSRFGIDGGRISKLQVTQKGKVVIHFDRGWDVKPTTETEQIVLELLRKEYN